MDFLRKHRIAVIIFSLAVLVRAILFFVNFSANDFDFVATIKGDDGYYELSQSLIEGRGFTWDTTEPYRPNPLRPPLWPLLIAFFAKFFGGYGAVLIFEIILGSFIPVLAFSIASRVFGHRVGKWTGFIMCFEPYLVLLSIILYTETSFIFFFLLSVLFFLRYLEAQSLRNAIWFGVFLAAATLIKPTIQYFPILIPVALVIIWRKSLRFEYLKHLGAFLAVFLILMAPWFYRNKVEFGVWGISAQPAFNLHVYLVPSILAIENGTSFKEEHLKQVGENFDPVSITLSNSDEYKDAAMKVLMEHKGALVKSTLLTLITFFTHDGMLTFLGYSGVTFENIISKPAVALLQNPGELFQAIVHYAKSPAVFVILFRLFWVVMTLAFLFGVWRFFKKEGVRTTAIFAICVVLYFAATTAINGLGVNARFRMPVDVFILGFALYGLFSLKRDNTRIASRQAA